ncbi:MAG TPA: hypothetical protein VKO87_00025 [Gemmatimonadaceae bacterium]|nr:hypothetical protein [Gemmatimonadaceae bacterium]
MRITLGVLLVSIAACAPEPTTPSDTSLAGVWTATAHMYTLSNFRLEMVQEPQGIVSGKWFARGDGGRGGCPEATPCDASGDLIGRNTVSQVQLELIGAGKFEGAQLESDRLRGVFRVDQSYDTITFVRAGNIAAVKGTKVVK